MKKILLTIPVILMTLLCLVGCADKDNEAVDSPSAGEYGAFEDLYPKLTYEVKDKDGNVVEQMYGLYSDAEFKTVAGTKDVYFSEETGKISQYNVTMGLIIVERTITFREDSNGNTFLTEMHYNSDGVVTKGSSENNCVDEEGHKIKEIAEQEYYSDGVTVKNLKVEVYRDGKLESTIVRKFDKDGKITSEEVS